MKVTGSFSTEICGNSKCTIVADTTAEVQWLDYADTRIISAVIDYPKIVDAEVLTHRMFARNSESKRAISYHRIRNQMGTEYFFTPIYGKEKRGMQDAGPLDPDTDTKVRRLYAEYIEQTIKFTDKLYEAGVHHQMINRYLEPFISTCRIMTGTITWWEHFIKLRLENQAEPHIQELGKCIKDAIDKSHSITNQLHVPFHQDKINLDDMPELDELRAIIEDSIARCARISYHNYEKDVSVKENRTFIDTLWDNGHSTPFEHVAANRQYEYYGYRSIYGDNWHTVRELYDRIREDNGRFLYEVLGIV